MSRPNLFTKVPVTGQGAANVARFESLGTLAAAARLEPSSHYHCYGGGSWTDGATWEKAIDLAATSARDDDPQRITRCEELMDRLAAEGLFVANDRLRWSRDFHGQRPDVNAYVAGDPMHWRRVRRPRTDKAPVRVVIDTTSSAAIDSKALAVRGVALTALVRALRMTRPTSLEVLTGIGGYNVAFYMLTTLDPDDLTAAAWALGSTGFARALNYPFMESRDSGGGWPYGVHPLSDTERRKAATIAREALALGPDDVLIPAASIVDVNKIVREPLAWLNQQLAADAEVAGREHVPLGE